MGYNHVSYSNKAKQSIIIVLIVQLVKERLVPQQIMRDLQY